MIPPIASQLRPLLSDGSLVSFMQLDLWTINRSGAWSSSLRPGVAAWIAGAGEAAGNSQE